LNHGDLMATYSREATKKKIEQLFERYSESYVESTGVIGARARDYSEQDTATKFIKPLIEALGWNLLNMNEVREEVEHCDCVLYFEEKPYIIFEFKPLDFASLRRVDFSGLLDKSKALGAKYAVVTRFKETIIYESETRIEAEYFPLPDDYLNKFDALWKYLSKPLA
jgi:hypothetical protein